LMQTKKLSSEKQLINSLPYLKVKGLGCNF
jgi:hypothetical protein